jgi:hypoxanthine phosphoribosyltransferase
MEEKVVEKKSLKISWNQFFSSVKMLESQIKFMNTMQPGTKFNSILAIGRGGLILGTILSHRLNLPLNVVMIERYTKENKPGNNIKVSKTSGPISYPVLVVDDIIDDGTTINEVIKLLDPNKPYSIAVLVNKSPGIGSSVLTTITGLKDVWVEFPWEEEGGTEDA